VNGLVWLGILIYAGSALWVSRIGVDSALEAVRALGFGCPVFQLTGWKCGFCGMTRAFVHLFGGEVGAASSLNLLSVPVFIGIPVLMLGWGSRRRGAFRLHPALALAGLVALALYALVRNLVPGIP
jgi:hypothetical protein